MKNLIALMFIASIISSPAFAFIEDYSLARIESIKKISSTSVYAPVEVKFWVPCGSSFHKVIKTQIPNASIPQTLVGMILMVPDVKCRAADRLETKVVNLPKTPASLYVLKLR